MCLEGRTAPLHLPRHRPPGRGGAPEKRAAGLRRAKALGCDWVEFDVRLTGDGCPSCATIRARPYHQRQRAGFGPHWWRSGNDAQLVRPGFCRRAVPTLNEALLLPRSWPWRQCRGEVRSGRERDRGRVASTVRRLGSRAPGVVSSFLVSRWRAVRACPDPAVSCSFVPRGWARWRPVGYDDRRRPRRLPARAAVRAAGSAWPPTPSTTPANCCSNGGDFRFSDAPDIIAPCDSSRCNSRRERGVSRPRRGKEPIGMRLIRS